MSGRLVILRHKSWHVWNQDNQEKVLRDERLQNEKSEEESSKNRGLLQEQQREVLLKTSNLSHHDPNQNEKFCLFDDPESINVARQENQEYMRETKEKERNIRKREGIADWSLSEGNTIVPWYSKAPIDTSTLQQQIDNSSSSSSVSNKRHVDIDKKRAAQDPASKFLTPYIVPSVQEAVKSDDVNITKKPEDSLYEKDTIHNNDGKKHKKKKRSKKEKTKKENKKHKKRKKTDSETTSNEDEASNKDKDESLIAALRQRRLERERVERHRTAVMLAERDIYGSSRSSLAEDIQADSRGHNYNQRYNPALSRN